MKSPVQFAAGATVLLIAAVLLGLPLAGVLPKGAAASTDEAQDHRMEIRRIVESWAQAYRTGEVERLEGLYSVNAVSVRDGAAPLTGRRDILAAAAADMAAFDFTVKVDLNEIELSGNTAWAMGRLTMKAAARAKGVSASYGSHYMAVFTRGADGKWRIHRDMQRRTSALFAEAS
ncbi:MAG: YybH family protein [Alphaproteobacteria bacterium]